MPRLVTSLTAAEEAALAPKSRVVDMEPYRALAATLTLDKWARMECSEDETPRVVKMGLRAAVRELGYILVVKATLPDSLATASEDEGDEGEGGVFYVRMIPPLDDKKLAQRKERWERRKARLKLQAAGLPVPPELAPQRGGGKRRAS